MRAKLIKTVTLTKRSAVPFTVCFFQWASHSGGVWCIWSLSPRWLGCILSVGRFHGTSLDAEFHLQAAGRTFFAVRVTDRLRFFDPSWVPDNPSTCFAKHGSCISKASSENDSSSCFCWLDPSLA
jgi:hypothetical protein